MLILAKLKSDNPTSLSTRFMIFLVKKEVYEFNRGQSFRPNPTYSDIPYYERPLGIVKSVLVYKKMICVILSVFVF